MARTYRKNVGPSITIKKKQEVLTRKDVATIVKKIENSTNEHKAKSFTGSFSVSSTEPLIYDLSQVGIGQEPFERVGRSLTLQSVEFMMSLAQRSATSQPIQFVRVILFQWKAMVDGANMLPPERQDILVTGTTSFAPLAPYELTSKSQYVILFDRLLSNDSTSPTGMIRKKINLQKKRFVKKQITYMDSADGDAGIDGANKIYMLIISDGPAPAASNGVIIPIYARITYTDA